MLPGPELSATELERVIDEVARLEPLPAYLVASGSLPPGVPPDFLARVARLTRERGSRFVLDAAGEPAVRALEAGVFLRETESPRISTPDGSRRRRGIPPEELEARRWIEAGRCEVVVLSLGAAGVLCVFAGRAVILSPTVPVRSTVGAGDSMLAGIVLRLQQGRSLPDALRFGVAAGAAAVMNPGTELCHLADAERLCGTVAAADLPAGRSLKKPFMNRSLRSHDRNS